MSAQPIGRGNFSEVYASNSLSVPTAVKKISLKHALAPQLILNETSFLSACNHPNIVKLYRSYEKKDEDMYCIEMEHLGGGDLTQAKIEGNIDLLESWVKQICSALVYLHERRIIHRDIKLSNLMLDNHGRVKIIDFGVSVWEWLVPFEENATIGSPCYMAPEIFLRKKYGCKVDIYALGVSIYQLIHGENPFKGSTKIEYWENTMSGNIYFADNCPKKWRLCILKMLDKNVQRRATAKEILSFLERKAPLTTSQKQEQTEFKE